MSRGCRAAVAASSWPAGDVARGGLARSGEKGSAWRDAAVWAKARGPACRLGRVAAIGALWARPVHAQKVFDEMLGWPKLLGIKCKSTGLGWKPLVGY